MKTKILCLIVLSLFALTLKGELFSAAKAETPSLPPPPCSASSVVMDNVNWLKQTPQGGTNIVRVTAVSNQQNRVASYADGELKITVYPFPPGPGQPPPAGPYTLGGTLTQYFSDRKFGLPKTGSGLSFNQYPFAPQKTDQLGIEITNTAAVTLTLNSWGGTKIYLTGVSCAGEVLYGLTNTNPMQSFYVISLSKEFQANTPILK